MGLKDRMKSRPQAGPDPEPVRKKEAGKSRFARDMAAASRDVKVPTFQPAAVPISTTGPSVRGKLPGLPVEPDAADQALVADKTKMHGAGLAEVMLALAMMMLDPVWAMAQYEVLRAWLASFPNLFRVVWSHTNPDLEFVAMSWLHTRFSEVRRLLGIHPYPTFVADRLPKPTQSPLNQVPDEILNGDKPGLAGYLGRFLRCIGFDVGGGPFDQHGRPENTQSSRVSSLDMMMVALLTEIQAFLAAVVMLSVISLNDRVATQVAAPGRDADDQPIPNVRDVLKALSRMGLPLQQYLEFGWIMLDAAYEYLCTEFERLLEELGGQSLAAFRALYEGPCRRLALRWDTILAHLPEQVTDAKAKATARVKAEELVAEALRTGEVSAAIPEQVERFRKERIAECEAKELAARAAYPQLLADFHRLTAEAIARHAAEKLRADAHIAQAETIILPNVCFRQQEYDWAQDRKRAGKAWRDRCATVTVHIVESDSYAAGAASRHVAGKAERERMAEQLADHFQVDGKLLPGMERIIKNRVRRFRPAVITAQIRNVRMVGNETWLNCTLVSSGMDMTDVQAAFTLRLWDAVYRKQGFLPPVSLGGPGDLTFVHPDGRRVIYAYAPEFRTAPGTWHETSQDKPGEPITMPEFKTTLLGAIRKVDARVREERAGDLPETDFSKLARAVRRDWLAADRAKRGRAVRERSHRRLKTKAEKRAERAEEEQANGESPAPLARHEGVANQPA